MKEYVHTYINKILSSLPVAIFIFTIVFFLNTPQIIVDLKDEFALDAIDELLSIYSFYFYRTLLLALLIPLFDVILSTDKFRYRNAVILHFIMINITVLILFYQPDAPSISILMIIALCTIIYIIVRAIIYYREKAFVDSANLIFSNNNTNKTLS